MGRGRGAASPGRVEGRGEKQLVVQGDAHVAWLMEGGGNGSGGVAQEAAPAQEQHLSCREVRGRDASTSSAAGLWPLSVPGVLGEVGTGDKAKAGGPLQVQHGGPR